MMLWAHDVRQAYTMISSSMMVVLTSLDTVWMMKTSFPRTDSWICTRVSLLAS